MPVTKKRPLIVLTDYSYETIQPFIDVYKAADFEFRPCQCKSPEEIIEACKDADAIQVHFAEITRDILAALPKCRLLVHSGVGMDTIDVDAARDLGIPACNVPDYGIEDVATHTILLMLAVTKKLNKLMDTVKRGVWDFSVAKPVHRLAGRTFGTIGCGAIARSTIQKAQAFGMNVISYDPFLTQEQVAPLGITLKSMDEVAAESDVISLHLHLNKSTEGMIGADFFRKMKKDAFFINTARVSAEAAAELKENGVELAEYDDVLTFLAAQAEEQTVLADPVSVNYAVYQTLQANPALTVKDEADPLLPMKGVKNEVELAHTREAHIRDGVAMVRFQIELENRLAAGEELTELTIDEILHKYRSAQDKFLTESFGTIAAYGPNAAMMHYHATEEDHAKLEKKGFLLVDSGATYMDGTTDITRTYPLGGLTEDERLFYTWTLQCHIDIARAVWLDYCDGHMLDTIAREPLWRHLINYRCGTGHSVSFVGNVHEGPHALNGRNTTVFKPGMIVTDEPGVYEGGVVGIRIENELECYHKASNQYGEFLAFRPITFVPIATSPIVPGVLSRDELDWLNAYHREVFEKLAPRLTEDERDWLAKKCAAIGA